MQLARIVVVLCVAVCFLAGCGGSSSGPARSPTHESSQTSNESTGTSESTSQSTESTSTEGTGAGGLLAYHDGPVMHSTRTYAIFWLPPGNHFEPKGSDERYMNLVIRFFKDIGDTPIYNILTQYGDKSGKPANQSTFGGSVVDTTAYPSPATMAKPLSDKDIRNEVDAVVAREGWQPDETKMFIVFTGSHVINCTEDKKCSERDVCGYHSAYLNTARQPVIYSIDPPTCISENTPNFDPIADSAIDTASHELFEAASDPAVGSGWIDADKNEIGDKCNNLYGPVNRANDNVNLHGHPYRIQLEWSNAAGGCSKTLEGP